MPVTKQTSNGQGPWHHHADMPHFAKRIMWTLVGILLAYMIVFFGTLIRNNIETFNYIGRADRQERTLTIEGQGKAVATPDVAMTTMGMIAEGKTVAEAQEKNTKVMNALIEKLKALGIAEKDIRTANYNIYPQYNYTQDKGQQLIGYQVQQQVTVKIRDLAKANRVLALAGEVGANNVSGLAFTIDDRETYKAQARALALEKVSEKARALSKALGVRLGAVIAYNEYEGGEPPVFKTYAVEGRGGAAAPAPDIEPGSTDVMMNVQVTFEMR